MYSEKFFYWYCYSKRNYLWLYKKNHLDACEVAMYWSVKPADVIGNFCCKGKFSKLKAGDVLPVVFCKREYRQCIRYTSKKESSQFTVGKEENVHKAVKTDRGLPLLFQISLGAAVKEVNVEKKSIHMHALFFIISASAVLLQNYFKLFHSSNSTLGNTSSE